MIKGFCNAHSIQRLWSFMHRLYFVPSKCRADYEIGQCGVHELATCRQWCLVGNRRINILYLLIMGASCINEENVAIVWYSRYSHDITKLTRWVKITSLAWKFLIWRRPSRAITLLACWTYNDHAGLHQKFF